MSRRNKQAVAQTRRASIYKSKFVRRSILFTVLGGVIGWFGWTTSFTDMFPIETVRAQGSFVHVNEKMLNTAINKVDGTGFFELDVAHVQQQVEALEWVEHAAVRRVWPDTLIIAIQERKPVAILASGGLIDAKGEIFRPAKDTYPQGLPVFLVSDNNLITSINYYYDSLAMLNKLGVTVNKVTYSDRQALSFRLDNKYDLVLGRESKLYRLTKFAKIYKSNIQKFKNNITQVDMRYTNGLSVEWKAGQQPVNNKSIARKNGKKHSEPGHV